MIVELVTTDGMVLAKATTARDTVTSDELKKLTEGVAKIRKQQADIGQVFGPPSPSGLGS